jgi:hypothetical protein
MPGCYNVDIILAIYMNNYYQMDKNRYVNL